MKYVIGYVHSHWDREWYREFEEFRLRLIEVFDEVLNALKNGELPCFYFDGQTAALEDYLEIFPEKEDEIKKLIKSKKLRIGPFYCSIDSFLVSGESFYRNLEIGIKKSKELGETDFIGYLADTFGHSRSIPYILKSFGIDKACLWRGLGEQPADLYWSGIKVTYLIQGYFQDFLNYDLPIEKKAKLLKTYIDKIALNSSDNILLPIGADHLTIAKNLNKQIIKLNKIYENYKIEIKTPFEYFEKIKDRKNVTGEFLENSLNFILPGVYSARIYLKQANAEAQWLLNRISEPLQALGSYYLHTKNKQNEIDYAYKILIKNHAHDSIYGCSIDKVHDEMMIRFEKVNSISNGIIKRTLRDLTKEKSRLSIINLSNFSYSGKVKIITEKKLPKWMNAIKINSSKGFSDLKLYNINQIPITQDYTNINEYIIDVKNLNAFSLTNISKEKICKEKNLESTKNFIENKYIKCEIKNNKILITDKIKNEIYKDFIWIIDRIDTGDSYNFGPLKNDVPSRAELKSYRLKEGNVQRAVLSLIYTININKRKHKINIDIILYNQAEYLEFQAEWINKSTNHILQMKFNLKDKIYKTLNEDLFGTIERTFNPDFDIYKYIPAEKGKEIKPNTSPMQRFMYTEDFGLITKGESEYEIIKNQVNLTLLRAVGIISNPKNSSRGTPAGPPIATPKLQCLGKNNAHFAITFSKNRSEMFRLADEFYNPCLTFYTNIKDMNFIEIQNKNILVYAIKTVKEGILYRLFNITEQEQKTQLISGKHKQTYSLTLKPKEIINFIEQY